MIWGGVWSGTGRDQRGSAGGGAGAGAGRSRKGRRPCPASASRPLKHLPACRGCEGAVRAQESAPWTLYGLRPALGGVSECLGVGRVGRFVESGLGRVAGRVSIPDLRDPAEFTLVSGEGCIGAPGMRKALAGTASRHRSW